MTFIYRYHHYEAPKERRHETLDAAIEDAAGALERGDAFPHEIVADTGDVILNQRDLLLRIGFSERWIYPCPRCSGESAPAAWHSVA